MNGINTLHGEFGNGQRWTISKRAERGPCGGEGCKGIHADYQIESQGQKVPLSLLGSLKDIHGVLKANGVDSDDFANEVNEIVQKATAILHPPKAKAATKKKARRRR